LILATIFTLQEYIKKISCIFTNIFNIQKVLVSNYFTSLITFNVRSIEFRRLLLEPSDEESYQRFNDREKYSQD